MATQPTIQTLTDPRYTDVVLYEEDFFQSRDVITVTNSGGGTFKQGTVVWRLKGSDSTAVWDVVDASGDISVNNEYAVLIGNDYEPNETIVLTAATPTKCIAITRWAIVKETVLKSLLTVSPYTLSATNFNDIKRLLAKDGILVNDSLVAIAP